MNTDFERVEVYNHSIEEDAEMNKFKTEFGNENFRTSIMTYFSFFMILLFAAQGFLGDQTDLLSQLDETLRILTYVFTIILQWGMVGFIYLALYIEKTFFRGVGVIKIRLVDFAWGFSLLFSLFVVATGAAYLLTLLGLPPKGEIAMLLPEELTGKFLWVGLSFTAGFCEEVIFRGYVMTRMRILFKLKSWTIPVIVSAFIFGFPHFYQGLPGLILTAILGVMFSIVYIRTKSLWPCILAHFFLDFLALFIPQ